MNDLFKKLGALGSEKLSEGERAQLRAGLLSFMEENPIVELVPRARHGYFNTQNLRRKSTIAILVGGMIALSGGISYAAEGSLPGDLLYPVKIHVNEGVQKALAVTPKAKADLASKEVERRASEAEKLEADDRLDDKTKISLASESNAHLDDFAAAKIKLEANGDHDAVRDSDEKMKKTLNKHRNTLVDLGLSRAFGEDGNEDETDRKGEDRAHGVNASSTTSREQDENEHGTTTIDRGNRSVGTSSRGRQEDTKESLPSKEGESSHDSEVKTFIQESTNTSLDVPKEVEKEGSVTPHLPEIRTDDGVELHLDD